MFCVIDDNRGYCDNLCGDNHESKNSLSPIPTMNHTLFKKDGVFGFHISTCHLEQLVTVVEGNVPRATHAGRGFIITSSFGIYPLLGACLLITYAHKRIRLLTRVYGISPIKNHTVSHW